MDDIPCRCVLYLGVLVNARYSQVDNQKLVSKTCMLCLYLTVGVAHFPAYNSLFEFVLSPRLRFRLVLRELKHF